MKKLLNKENAITLIALVVTIIILLILAGVTIGVATNGTGLFEKAKLATDKYNDSVEKENTELAKITNQIDNYISGNRDTISYNYSLDEQVVGTWIDGKPLYQKTIKTTLGDSNTWINFTSIENVDTLIDAKGIYSYSNVYSWCIIPDLQSALGIYNGYPGYYHCRDDWKGKNAIFTYLYTKTTDAATRIIE